MFPELFHAHNFSNAIEKVKAKSLADVEGALHRAFSGNPTDFNDYLAFVSPSAAKYLETMASIAQSITMQRFGKTMQLFMPLYLSNECRSSCLYCGFSFENKIPRKTLKFEELRIEAELISQKGINHILILTGEDYSHTPVEYISDCIQILKEYFSSVAIEVYPLEVAEYEKLINAGADGLVLYQETYDPVAYKKFHIRGVKKDMEYRLSGPDRGGLAGFRKIGLGALLGLSNALGEMYFIGLHAQYMFRKYWRSSIQISLPRMRPAQGDFHSIIPVPDPEFVQYILALRIFLPDAGIVLSTRENPDLRDNLAGIAITTMSAGSRTEPGGYQDSGALEQFATEDKRDVSEIMKMLSDKGIDPVLKDFDRVLS
ncbi:MAG: 2-iminoacetate synthase ThiH [Leptospira sp.]|nr:2-iminoacetate synthase ThiH [Leptospira sp.]